MRNKLIEAVREHRAAQGECTGYFLVTFCNGQAVVSGEADGADEVATEIIRVLADCMGEEGDNDAIGPCRGRA
jgi:hypothetical protein